MMNDEKKKGSAEERKRGRAEEEFLVLPRIKNIRPLITLISQIIFQTNPLRVEFFIVCAIIIY